jgi:hypothetical protein
MGKGEGAQRIERGSCVKAGSQEQDDNEEGRRQMEGMDGLT